MTPEVELTAIPWGELKRLFVPTPFVAPHDEPVAPPPASVMTVRFEKTARILWFAESATYMTPALLIATPDGLLKPANVPMPLTAPGEFAVAPPPANVMTLSGSGRCKQNSKVGVNDPEGHAVQAAAEVEPAGENVKKAQGVQVALELAPVAAEKVFAGHAVGAAEGSAQ